MTPPLCGEKIAIAYDTGSDPVLRAVDIELHAGEVLVVVGPNGSGKSTLVRSLSRVLRPTGGLVLLDGRDLYSSRTSREAACKIGVVSQTVTVAFDFTVREVVEMGRLPYLPAHPFAGLGARDRAVVDGALATMAIATLQDRAVHTLSGGEQQRVMIARALAQEPDVLLLDEPTAHLDVQHQLGVLALLRRLAHKQGKAVMAVLHDLNMAAAYADRMVLLKDGVVVAAGSPADVLSPANVEAAYETRVWLRSDPASGRPFVTPLPEIDADPPCVPGLRVHLIGGGGAGTPALFLLCQLGCDVTLGTLNAGDTDQEAADALGARYPLEKPFTAISEEAARESAALAADAALVVVAEIPFGRGNLPNLEHAVALRESGRPVLLMQSTGGIADRDFAGGAATRLWARLLALGAEPIGSLEDLTARVCSPAPE